MSCEAVREQLSALLDGALSPMEEGEVREHLLSCEACFGEHEELADVVKLVREIPKATAPPGFAESVVAALPRRRRSRGRTILLASQIAVAACLLLIAYLGTRPGEVGSSPGAAEESGSALKVTRRLDESEKTLESGDSERDGPRKPSEDGRVAGMREPEDPRAPAAPQAPEAPARSRAELGGKEGALDLEKSYLKYLICGIEPDAAAGVILAELHRHRGHAGAASRVSALETLRLSRVERLVPDARGEPSFLLLDLTSAEIDMLQGVFGRERWAQMLRRNGADGEAKAKSGPVAKKAEEAEDDAPAQAGEAGAEAGGSGPDPQDEERHRVVIEFKKARVR